MQALPHAVLGQDHPQYLGLSASEEGGAALLARFVPVRSGAIRSVVGTECPILVRPGGGGKKSRRKAAWNPPIRDRASRRAVWEQLRRGNVASISTDHAAWPIETKQRSMLRASAGTPGLETLLPLLVTAGADQEIALPALLGYVTWRPGEIFGLGGRKGRLATGFDADLAVFDARRKVVFDASSSATNARWSPFDGFGLAGRVEATYVRGQEVYGDGAVVGAPGGGSWLRRG
jgi:allantoinase